MKPARLPSPNEVRVFGWGKARAIRALYRERCSLVEIETALRVPAERVSQALRWKGHVNLSRAA